MLKPLLTHSCYLSQLDCALAKIPLEFLAPHQFDIQLMKQLNFDPAFPLIQSMFSSTGRPANCTIQLFRAFFYGARYALSPKSLRKKLLNERAIRAICGFQSSDEVPAIGTFYNFLSRMVPIKEEKKLRSPIRKKELKTDLGDDGKLKDKRPQARTTRLAERIIDQKVSLADTPDRFMQSLFAKIAVDPSVQAGLIEREWIVSGDGTCFYTGASSKGKKVCKCRDNHIYQCDCPRKFSDTFASYGWDSHQKRWYYGYTAYFACTYSKKFKKDLPLSVRFLDAKRHDSLGAMFCLVDLLEVYPEYTINTFLGDSAMDCGAMYFLLHHFKINAVIDLNQRNAANSSQEDITFDKKGRPICPGNLLMKYHGKWERNRLPRIKYRCPAKVSKMIECPLKEPCSDSDYGRTVYVKDTSDLRIYPNIPRGSKEWKELYKQRTACERINKQVLIDHQLEHARIRTKHRNYFYTIMSCVDIHLKAQISIG